MTTATRVSAADFLRQHLATLDPNLMMGYVFQENFREATGNGSFGYDDMVKAAEEVRSNGYDLVPRYPDDFSPEPYLWVTPTPKPLEFPDGKPMIPDSFWVIRNPDNTCSLRIKEGLLIFSHPGYAAGHMTKQGVGDFGVTTYTKAQIIESAHYDQVVLDFIDGHPPTIIPLED